MSKIDWPHTATNILGEKRQTMGKNMLHLKPELGHSKSFCHNIPPKEFVYGMKNVKVDGVPDVMVWPKSVKMNQDKLATTSERDLIALNKEAVKFGACNEKDAIVYRSFNDIRRSIKNRSLSYHNSSNSTKLFSVITHGVASKPSVPIFELISNRYQEEWLNNQQKLRTAQNLAEKKKHTSNRNTCADTRTTLLRDRRVIKEPKELWKMDMFKEVTSGISTFRDEESKKRAYRYNKLESIGRHGQLGQGIVRIGTIPAS